MFCLKLIERYNKKLICKNFVQKIFRCQKIFHKDFLKMQSEKQMP
ncbi:MAG: hypothetical protein OJF59_003234 [Cytophagales bacterium]|nr:MAG: hypothetical protein OJF59_003234 [Cytophagales bacterium]